MANRADVYIKNILKQDIKAFRKLPDGGIDSETAIDNGNEVMIPLQGTDVALVINAPKGKDIKDMWIKMNADVDLAVSGSRTDSNWTIKIVPNELPPDSPTTVNVEVGATGS